MNDFSNWDWAERFTLEQVAALIDGQEPSAAPAQPHRLQPILKRLVDACVLAYKAHHRKEPIPADALPVIGINAVPTGLSGDLARTLFAESPQVQRDEIVRWLGQSGLQSRYQFERPPTEPLTDAAVLTACRWPWGEHHTEALGHLEAAARRFWVNYDPTDNTTAPTNQDVSGWLQSERGLSRTMADAMASILRPDGLPTGPRK